MALSKWTVEKAWLYMYDAQILKNAQRIMCIISYRILYFTFYMRNLCPCLVYGVSLLYTCCILASLLAICFIHRPNLGIIQPNYFRQSIF